VALMKIVSKPSFCKNVLQLLDWFEVANCLVLVLERPVPCMDVFSLFENKDDVQDELLAKIIMLQVSHILPQSKEFVPEILLLFLDGLQSNKVKKS
ncbi:MAG: hypothetical protein ACRC4N_00960, partial [Gammaproteobacteria bacterium]